MQLPCLHYSRALSVQRHDEGAYAKCMVSRPHGVYAYASIAYNGAKVVMSSLQHYRKKLDVMVQAADLTSHLPKSHLHPHPRDAAWDSRLLYNAG